MTYQLIDKDTILRVKDNVFIPVSETNADYRDYLDWLKIKGNKPLPIQTPESAEPSPLEKLQAAGLTIDDLRQLLSEVAATSAAAESAPADAPPVAEPLPAEEAVPAALAGTPPPAERLGQEWLAPDGSRWVVIQAREENGQFAADDPDTELRENLEWAQAPIAGDEAPQA